MVNSRSTLTARTKARQAKAALDVQRAEQDRLVVDVATEFYEAVDAVTAARAATETAEQDRAGAVARLVELGQSDDQVAALCAITVKEVRELRRRPSPTTPAAGSPPADTAPPDTAPSDTAPSEKASSEKASTKAAA